MIQAWKVAAGLALAATTASAGGIERTARSPNILFEDGNLVELSFGSVDPSVSGVGVAVSTGIGSGNISERYSNAGLSIKRDLTEKLSLALIYDQPFGANVNYPAGTGYFAGGITEGASATLTSNAVTGLVKYTTDTNISIYGGLRYQTLEAVASLPFVAGYGITSNKDGSLGYVAGVAYERPDIALRVALTYNSSIQHDFTVVETGPVPGTTALSAETPQALNLDFQSGIAKDTLVFGSIRWVEWTAFKLSPVGYVTATSSDLVSYSGDTVTYTLGVGRRFNENWSGALSIMHEPSVSGFSTNLGPTNGKSGATIGVTYKQDDFEITGGISYVWIGDATTTLSSLPAGTTAASFTDNTAIGAGLRIRYRF